MFYVFYSTDLINQGYMIAEVAAKKMQLLGFPEYINQQNFKIKAKKYTLQQNLF